MRLALVELVVGVVLFYVGSTTATHLLFSLNDLGRLLAPSLIWSVVWNGGVTFAGWVTLYTGWQKLRAIVIMARMEREHRP